MHLPITDNSRPVASNYRLSALPAVTATNIWQTILKLDLPIVAEGQTRQNPAPVIGLGLLEELIDPLCDLLRRVLMAVMANAL